MVAAPSFGSSFRRARVAAGKTARETAQHLRVSSTYLSDVERGARPPLSAGRILDACSFFGADPADLLVAGAAETGYFSLPAAGLSGAGLRALAALQVGGFSDDFFGKLTELARSFRR